MLYKNFKIEKVSENYWQVKADSVRFGDQAIVYEGISETECRNWIKEQRYLPEKYLKRTFVEQIVPQCAKKLAKACVRNEIFTSAYVLELIHVDFYAEGMYWKFSGCQTGLNIFCTWGGKVIRKPRNITKVCEYFLHFYEGDYDCVKEALRA